MNVKAKKRIGATGRLNPKIKFDAALASVDSGLTADLATSESKYLAEVEKPLNLVLDAQQSSNISLIFDDADDLFGKRSSGKPS